MKKNVFYKLTALLLTFVMSFFVFGCSTTTTPSSKYGEIKNIVLIIGDGMGLEHIAAGELYEDEHYGFTDWKFVSVNTDSVNAMGDNFITTDSAASGTALATGYLTINGYVGKEYHGNDVNTIMDYAKSEGKSTGVVSTDTIFGATPAAFSGHAIDRNESATIVDSQLTSGVDLLCGSISTECTDKADAIAANGYTLCTDYADIENAKTAEKAYWQFDMAGYNASVKLDEVATHALDYLSKNDEGFVLMIEQAYIDKYSHNNDTEGMVKSVSSLNDTVEAVLKWIGNRKDTAILITADHETGGLTVTSREQTYNYLDTAKGNKMYYAWESGSHTDSKVGLFVYGINPDYSQFSYYKSTHLIKNINVYNIMQNLLYDGKIYAD